MECGKYKEQISLMIDGELGVSASAALKAHMAGCPDCRRFHERLNALGITLSSTLSVDPSSALAERVKERLARRRNHRLERDPVLWRRVPVMAMIVLLALGLGNLAGRSISDLFTSGQNHNSLELIAPDSESSLSDALIELSAEENHQ
jgi:anti-sigma factor RsiW